MGEYIFKESNLGECFSRDERKNGVQLSGGGFHDLRTFVEMKDEIFLCRIGTCTARFELMPTDSNDGNTNKIAQVWRCPLHGIPGREPVLSDSDFQQLRRHSTDHNAVLTIDVLYEGAGLTSVVLKLHLPIAEPSLGIQCIYLEPLMANSFVGIITTCMMFINLFVGQEVILGDLGPILFMIFRVTFFGTFSNG
jgi:hypothetical protein